MGETYKYNGSTLTIVRTGTVELTQSAELGQVGAGRVALDDTAGTQAIVGQKDFTHRESLCSFTRTFDGYVNDRTYGRDAGVERAPDVGAARGIGVELLDQNAMLGFRFIYPYVGSTNALAGIRPAETVAARMAWLMASPFVVGSSLDPATLFIDNGRIASSSNVMSENNYRHQYPGDVIADCALAAQGFNYYIRDFGSGAELVFRDDNTSTADTSTLRISNLLSDASAVTIHPFKDFTLRRDPSNVYSALGFQWAKGASDLGRAATATTFNGWRSGVVSDSNVLTATEALSRSANLLFQRSTEEDILEGTVLLTSAQVNLIMHGDRIQAKFTHLATEGYGSFSYFRVLERTVKPIVADGGLYEVHLKLSPQEAVYAAPVAGSIRQHAESPSEVGGYADFPSPALAGSLILVRMEWHPSSGTALAGGGQAMEAGAGYTQIAQAEARGENNAGVAVFAKDAAGGEQHISRDTGLGGANMHLCVYEITGATLADVEVVSKSRQVTSAPQTLSAHVAATGLAFDTFIAVHVEAGLDRTWVGSPGNAFWTEHYDQGPTPYPTEFPGTNWKPPWIWEGNATPTGASLTPSVSLTPPAGKTLSEWAGISVLVR